MGNCRIVEVVGNCRIHHVDHFRHNYKLSIVNHIHIVSDTLTNPAMSQYVTLCHTVSQTIVRLSNQIQLRISTTDTPTTFHNN